MRANHGAMRRLALLLGAASGAAAGSFQYIDLSKLAPDAQCLDGSPYGFAFCPAAGGSKAAWTINLQVGPL